MSSLDQPVFDSRQHSYSGSSHDDQTGADLQQMVLEEGTKSDSNTTGMGVEDSGFGTGDSASWAMAAEGAADQTSTAGIMKEGMKDIRNYNVLQCILYAVILILYNVSLL